MEIQRDAESHEALARAARARAAQSGDPDLSLRLREVAIRHERKARPLRRGSRDPV